jgi:hypothetical protein
VDEAMTAHLDEEIENQRQAAPSGQLDKLKNSTVENGRRAIGGDQAEVCMKKRKRRLKEQNARPPAATPIKKNLSQHGPWNRPWRSLKSGIAHPESAALSTIIRLAYRPRCFV